MASLGYIESQLGPLPPPVKGPIVNMARAAFKDLRFGAPDPDGQPNAAENFGGHFVPFVTSSTANGEVAVAHRLGRIPRLSVGMLQLDVVNSTVPVLTVTRAADATYLYLSSDVTGAAVLLYVE